jgi:RNA recognition motif-containing protein
MNTKLHIGNVSTNTTQAELRSLFARQGPVLEVKLVMDAATRRSRGYAFVTMETHEGAKAALAALNGEMIDGRFITVSESREHVPHRTYRKLY